MPELRYDVLSGDYAVIATHRAKRPSDFKLAQKPDATVPKYDPGCPFCPGNEKLTPPEVLALREESLADGEGWTVRVVPNKFPAFFPAAQDEAEAVTAAFSHTPAADDASVFWQMPAIGAHEVVIESTRHDATLGSYDTEHLESILEILKSRSLALYDQKEVKYVQVFRNTGTRGGASLSHPHFQIIALPVLPPRFCLEASRFEAYKRASQRCLLCDLVEREMEKDTRIVAKTEHFVAFCPFASRHSFETAIVPREHHHSFASLSPKTIRGLAEVMGAVFEGYESLFSSLPYNLMVHSAPPSAPDFGTYHWHIHVLPRLTIEAGLELGTGVQINPTPPEEAARQFRTVR